MAKILLVDDDNELTSLVAGVWETYTESGVEALRAAVKRIRKEIDDDGLGLALSKALVELHGGKIGVSDASPKGCEFWILLPKSDS